jgi:hypothetical protein
MEAHTVLCEVCNELLYVLYMHLWVLNNRIGSSAFAFAGRSQCTKLVLAISNICN